MSRHLQKAIETSIFKFEKNVLEANFQHPIP